MFSIKRFDGRSEPAAESSDGSKPPVDRIALLNQRKQQQQQQQQQIVQPVVPDVTKIASPAGGLPIHPSRLAASQALRQSDRKARSSANGTSKEKTRAKQRYLNRKKDRRKKRKVAAVASAPKKKDTTGAASVSASKELIAEGGDNNSIDDDDGDEEEKEDDDDDDSDDDEDDDTSKDDLVPIQPSIEQTIPPQEMGDQVSDDVVMTDIENKSYHQENAPTTQSQPTTDTDAGLTRFPAPRATMQATQRDLAVQGLPEGLAQPKVVDAAHTATVSKSAQSDGLELIADTTRARLNALGITNWFAVQTAIIPKLLAHPTAFDLYPSPAPGDVCVSAPTGSGKTLSYVVPIVEVLQRRICRRVRALILLPTRDLVHQVRETLEAVAKNTGLTIASLTGQQSFAHEQTVLVDADPSLLQRDNVPGLFRASINEEEKEHDRKHTTSVKGGRAIESRVDIVIATPGRLIDHMDRTPGFTLQHLRFLVIDEADRLLSQSFQEWLPRVLAAIEPPSPNETAPISDDYAAAMSPAWLHARRSRDDDDSLMTKYRLPRPTTGVQKLLFSATLTRDPAKIVALNLRDATFFSVEDAKKDDDADEKAVDGDWHDAFALPASLREHMIVSATADKPLHLLHLLYTHDDPLRQVLCFTKSVESANRLVKLLGFFEDARQQRHARDLRPSPSRLVVGEYSSDLRGAQRISLLDEFRTGRVDVLVCSDVISRGIDLPTVQHVVSYDAPIDMAKYVHRVGRTARAGREGDAWTLIEEQEARHFTAMMRRAGRWSKMNKMRTPKHLRALLRRDDDKEQGGRGGDVTADERVFADLVHDYQSALQSLASLFSRNHVMDKQQL